MDSDGRNEQLTVCVIDVGLDKRCQLTVLAPD